MAPPIAPSFRLPVSMPDVTILYGGPGSGKTTALLAIMERELQQLERNQVAFCSFTRQASYGARDRAVKQFGGVPDQYPYFRTLHSLAYRELSMGEGTIMQEANRQDIAKSLNLSMGQHVDMYDGPMLGRPDANKLLSMCELARNRLVHLEQVWREMRNPDMGWHLVKRYMDTLLAYKRDTGLYDFTDVLELYLQEGLPLPVKVALIDEAQDLTPLQWRLVHKAFGKVDRLFVAGDDDQAIFRWAGAVVEMFQNLPGEVQVLDKSHRLPKVLFDAAQVVVGKIRKRTPKAWTYARRGGVLRWYRRLEAVPDMTQGSWLLLARNKHLLRQFKNEAHKRGVYFTGRAGDSVDKRDVAVIQTYEALRRGGAVSATEARQVLTAIGAPPQQLDPEGEHTGASMGLGEAMPIWHEAFTRMPQRKRVYIVECLRRGEKLQHPPRVRIDTVHSAKGAEADNVVLLTDMTGRTKAGARQHPDDEWRCLYVGMTRASQALHMMLPGTVNHYDINARSLVK